MNRLGQDGFVEIKRKCDAYCPSCAARALCIVAALAIAQAAWGQAEQPAKPILEFWEAVYLQGSQIGYAHGKFVEKGDLIEGDAEMHLMVHRFGQPMRMDFAFATQETKQGQVRRYSVRQSLGTEELVRSGVIENGRVKMTKVLGAKGASEEESAWNDRAIGLYAQEQLYAKQEMKAGLEFDFLSFVPDFNAVLSTHVKVNDRQATDLLGGRKVPFWRVTVKVQKIANVQLPAMTCWVNDSGELYKREQNIPGLGDVTFYRTSKERAMSRSSGPVTNASDIGFSQLVRVNRSIPNFNQTKEVTYRVKLKDTEDLETVFAKDQRQDVRLVGKEELDIRVRNEGRPERFGFDDAVRPAEFLKSSHFISSDDARVKTLARQAVQNAQQPWDKAVRIEAWVRQNMTNKDYGKAFATAGETAKTLDGDCTEHAVLATAMCRAVGVPSRTAIGLVHVPNQKAMCFHMWFEVWIGGRWYALDGTLGQGRVGAGHVKVLDAHWNDTDSFLPLLPVVKLLGKLKMDVLSVEYEAGVTPR